MARPVTGKIMEDRLWVKQKNGTWYCYERKRVWEDGKAKNISKTLLGKASERGGELRPTRAKRKPGSKESKASSQPQAIPTALSEILHLIGTDSGIDKDLRASCGYECAEEIVSLARYATATDCAAWPGIEAWMLTHPVPAHHPITSEDRLCLFEEIGSRDGAQESFFVERCKHEDDTASLIAFDITTLASHSDRLDAWLDSSGDRRGLSTSKHLVLYSLDTERPLGYRERQNNVLDASSIGEGLKYLRVRTDADMPVVTDVRHALEAEVDAILASDAHLLARLDANLPWVREAIEPHLNRLENASCLLESDLRLNGLAVSMTREVATADGKVSKKLNLLVYRDTEVKIEQDAHYIDEIWRVQRLVEEGAVLDERSERIRKRYLRVRRLKNKVSVTMNKDTVNGDARLNGVFVLVSDYLADANEALGIWNIHERIQDGLGRLSQGSGRRSSTSERQFVLAGRMFVQFVALCYTEEIRRRIDSVRHRLDKAYSRSKYGGPAMDETEWNLRQWLDGRSLHDILLWFDAHETQAVSKYVTDDKWGADGAARDRLFIELMGTGDTES